jgi:hypothetical protein
LLNGEDVPPAPEFYSASLMWGRRNESLARARYEWEQDCDVEVSAFVVHAQLPFVGCSPDGFRQEGKRIIGLEIKCPYSQEVHAQTLIGGFPYEHKPQVQGQAWVCDFAAVDFVSFDPRRTDGKELYVSRQPRDDAYITVLAQAVIDFWDFVQSDQDSPRVQVGGPLPRLF